MTTEEAIHTDHYRTLRTEGSGLYKEKGSKFYSYSFPASSVNDALQCLDDVKAKHHDAGHHCFAYRINPEKPEFRANDDGEPSNSAGMPIYNQLQSQDLWNCIVIVVRYFGGTKLGVGGLINAYKEAAALALANSHSVTRYLIHRLELRFPYPQMNEVMRLLKSFDVNIIEEKMEQDAGYLIGIRKNNFSTFKEQLKNIHQVEIA
ncbi:MAG: YigZ family protein [Owenweeksia sp.]|nr:YigZ family protein [Owenweeksia sp.]